MSDTKPTKTFVERFGKPIEKLSADWIEACKKFTSAKTKLEQIVKLTEDEINNAEIDSSAIYVNNDTFERVFYCVSTNEGKNVIVASYDKDFENKAIEYELTKEYFLTNFTKLPNIKASRNASIALG